jgi:hypothetical protein
VDIGEKLRLIFGGIAGLLMLIVAIAALLACVKTRPAAFAFRCLCLCPLLFALLATWLLTALIFFISTLGSDICFDPTAAILDLANSTIKPGTIYDTISFYISPCGSAPPRGAYKLVQVGARTRV